jgi:hypothetical protein
MRNKGSASTPKIAATPLMGRSHASIAFLAAKRACEIE